MNIFFETLNIIRPIVDKVSSIEDFDAIYLFGSRARGNAQTKSDIDLAINCPTVNSYRWNDICGIIENAPTLIKIDCVRFDELSPNSPLRAEIEKDKIVVFQKRVNNSYDLNLIFESTEKALIT
ncbi:MAG: nucleotidyltransferase domain-containing protein [Proteobacteria bacterium]|nr:nucleotidyltransferase domain-containing protein [Pseudomonadota bacterium]